jgi:hypothetical protein
MYRNIAHRSQTSNQRPAEPDLFSWRPVLVQPGDPSRSQTGLPLWAQSRPCFDDRKSRRPWYQRGRALMAYSDRPGWKARGASIEAAYAVARHATTLRTRVFSFLRDRYPAAYSADQIADGLGETILSVRPRVSELNKMGAIEVAEGRHKNQSGMSAHCWRAVARSGGGA